MKCSSRKAESSLAQLHLSHSLNSLKGVIQGIIYKNTLGDIKGDARSLDYSSSGFFVQVVYRQGKENLQ